MKFAKELDRLHDKIGQCTSRADAREIEQDPTLDLIATRGDEEDIRTAQSLIEALIFAWPPDAKERAARDAALSARPKPRPVR